MRGQASADAIADLQNRGFKTRTQQQPDSKVPPDHVISTDPAANASVAAGDTITDQRVDGPRAARGARRRSELRRRGRGEAEAAGFGTFKQARVAVHTRD